LIQFGRAKLLLSRYLHVAQRELRPPDLEDGGPARASPSRFGRWRLSGSFALPIWKMAAQRELRPPDLEDSLFKREKHKQSITQPAEIGLTLERIQ